MIAFLIVAHVIVAGIFCLVARMFQRERARLLLRLDEFDSIAERAIAAEADCEHAITSHKQLATLLDAKEKERAHLAELLEQANREKFTLRARLEQIQRIAAQAD
jgi:DNA-binding ferritin-like protein